MTIIEEGHFHQDSGKRAVFEMLKIKVVKKPNVVCDRSLIRKRFQNCSSTKSRTVELQRMNRSKLPFCRDMYCVRGEPSFYFNFNQNIRKLSNLERVGQKISKNIKIYIYKERERKRKFKRKVSENSLELSSSRFCFSASSWDFLYLVIKTSSCRGGYTLLIKERIRGRFNF